MSATAEPQRLPLVEYGPAEWTISGAAAECGISADLLLEHLARATPRVQSALRNRKPRLEIEEGGVRAEGFAGLLRLAGGVELEIAPKFLGSVDPTWREDFFAVATLSHFGRLLPAEALLARRGRQDDLATLAARALVEMVHESRHRPLRTYRRSRIVEFSGDGDVDPESLLLPGAEGFKLESFTLTNRNAFNATIQAAAAALRPEVRDAETGKHLERIERRFGAQSPGRDLGRRRTLPGRARAWQAAYDLSCDVLEGFGVRYGDGSAIAPGYLLDTWRAWQDLVALGVRLALPGQRVESQAPQQLGWRTSRGSRKPAKVTPDLLVPGSPPLVIDAKYKGRADRGRTAVSETDLYEALAFLEAVGGSHAVLLYPAIPKPSDPPPPTGTTHTFERIEVGSRIVLGAEVEVRRVSQVGGLNNLGSGLAAWFRDNGLA